MIDPELLASVLLKELTEDALKHRGNELGDGVDTSLAKVLVILQSDTWQGKVGEILDSGEIQEKISAEERRNLDDHLLDALRSAMIGVLTNHLPRQQ